MALKCKICDFAASPPQDQDLGVAVGNTARVKSVEYNLWRCPNCKSLHSIDTVDLADIYRDYPLNERKLDFFARRTLGNLLSRLQRAGLKKHHRILDYGCGNGIFVGLLKSKGYENVFGFDPYVQEFANPVSNDFDCVVLNDVLEHVEEPRQLIADCANLVRPGGLLYVGTCESDGIDPKKLKSEIMRLHQPFHRVILSRRSLTTICTSLNFEIVNSYAKSYMDTLIPFANYRFLHELSSTLNNDLNLMLGPQGQTAVFKRPALLFYGFFGYFMPSAYEPAFVLRKPQSTHD